nr:immunoglobulin light chain junction region [Macaca mulatta]
CQQYNGDPYSF